MDPMRFDKLTKTLATRDSRRQALRRIGGILGGTALAGLFPGLALAGGGNSACAHWCAAVFGADTSAAGQCTSDAAHHKGLCYTCGPASPGGTQPICCPQNPDGTCSSYSSATCCSGGQVCRNAQCVSCIPNGGFGCSADSDCCSGVCETYEGTCGCGPTGTPCSRNADCCSNNCQANSFGALFCT